MKAPTAFTTVWLGVLLVTAASIHVHPDTNRSRMEANSSTSWTLVFRQTVPYLFSSNQWSLNSGDSSNANYAILDQLENYRGADGKFTFKLNWPGSTYHGAAMLDQIWKQSLNPVGSSQASSRPVAGYEAVSVPYTGMYWGGLEGGSSYALLDGSVASQLFFYTVGLYQERSYGIPCAASTTTDYHLGCSVVELYVGGTPSPTSSPTPSPTPTPAPAASATGDPHLQNIHGERFDLMRPGNAVLIQIPRGQPFEKSWLTVEADARRLGSQCADMYFQSLNITGKGSPNRSDSEIRPPPLPLLLCPH
ncbi:unnamed protein product [Prorocentrum cordatum]|uniref:Uncharacterized protein n=1 Tax=Prorocentrum cordatum TaxID=2364126 RepID=A0ABN9W3U3_9DINO|nr:unnamed protein product [Polarella glacialis]